MNIILPRPTADRQSDGCRVDEGPGGDVVVVVLLVTNSDLSGALRTALTPYRLLRLALAHD